MDPYLRRRRGGFRAQENATATITSARGNDRLTSWLACDTQRCDVERGAASRRRSPGTAPRSSARIAGGAGLRVCVCGRGDARGWRCSTNSRSDSKSAFESTCDALSMNWASESDEGRSKSWDASSEMSRSVWGGIASVVRAAGSGRVKFGRSICVMR